MGNHADREKTVPHFEAVPSHGVDHPQHYGGKNNPYEAIKVIDAWSLGFCLGNVLKYICRLGKKGTNLDYIADLKKARWYLDHEIEKQERELAHDD